MKFEHDSAKDASNRAKHGMSLTEADRLDWDAMLIQADDTEAYGEDRWRGIAPKGDRLYTVVFTIRGEDTVRVISLRRATNTEIRRYESKDRKQEKVQTQHRGRGRQHPRRNKGRS